MAPSLQLLRTETYLGLTADRGPEVRPYLTSEEEKYVGHYNF